MDIDFTDVLEKSRALRARQEASSSGFGDSIPRLERALPQIDRESRRLARPDARDSPNEASALRLLSAYGFETDKIERTLQSVALLDAFEPYTAFPDTDLDSYLAAAHEVAVVTAIEGALQHTASVSLAGVATSMDAEWEASKRDLVTMSALQYRAPGPQTSRAASTAPGGAFASPFRFPRNAGDQQGTMLVSPGDDSGRRQQQFGTQSGQRLDVRRPSPAAPIYESIVRRAVHARANPSVSVAIATELDDALVSHLAPRGDPQSAPKSVQHLHAVFTALRYIVGEASSATPPPEGAYGAMHLAEDRRKASLGALRFLCLQFREDKMRRELEARPVEANRGGVPGLVADVRAYLNLVFDRGVPEQLATGGMLGGLPLWPQVYYCLRAGDPQAALDNVRDAIREGCSDSSVGLFEECLTAFLASDDRRVLPDGMLGRLVQDYGLSARRGQDPYQRVCYVVLARLDPAAGDKMALLDNDYALLFYSIEDYLWLRLSVARLDGDSIPPDALSMYGLTLASIQEEIRNFGPAHFDPRGDTPVFYALVLLLSGQYAAAITYLDTGARAIAEATHIAFVLYYYGMVQDLRDIVNGIGEAGGREGDYGCYRIDYPDLLWRYVSRFERTDPAAAAVYLFTLRDANARNEFLKRLLLDTKEFGLLIGATTSPDGDMAQRQIGVLEELWPLGGRDAVVGGSWVSVVEAAASAAEDSGDRSSAVTLYDVAGVPGKVVAILIDKLSAELTSRDSPARARVLADARQYKQRLEQRRMRSGMERLHADGLLERLLPSFHMLLALAEFFDRLWQKQYASAWRGLQSLSILPSNDSQLVAKTQELRVGGGAWADAVCDRVPEVLLGAMEAIAALHAKQRRLTMSDATAERSTAGLRAAARTLVNFSGMMHNPSADISARLVRLEVLMT